MSALCAHPPDIHKGLSRTDHETGQTKFLSQRNQTDRNPESRMHEQLDKVPERCVNQSRGPQIHHDFFTSKGSRRFYELLALSRWPPTLSGWPLQVSDKDHVSYDVAHSQGLSLATPSPSMAALTPSPHLILESNWVQGPRSVGTLLSRAW